VSLLLLLLLLAALVDRLLSIHVHVVVFRCFRFSVFGFRFVGG
jgi:hypothetical protein